MNETREVGTGTYLRSTDGTKTVHLGVDTARGLSPDGGWALVQARGDLARLTLVPTGAGVPREVPLNPGLVSVPFELARWSRDGRRLFLPLRSSEGGPRSTRVYARDNDAEWRAVTPAGITGPFVVSPDGQLVAANDETGSVALFRRRRACATTPGRRAGTPGSLECRRASALSRGTGAFSRPHLSPRAGQRARRALAHDCPGQSLGRDVHWESAACGRRPIVRLSVSAED